MIIRESSGTASAFHTRLPEFLQNHIIVIAHTHTDTGVLIFEWMHYYMQERYRFTVLLGQSFMFI